MEGRLSRVEEQLTDLATKGDLVDVREFFERRDDLYTRNLWRALYGLIIAICAIAFAFVGVREIPKLFL